MSNRHSRLASALVLALFMGVFSLLTLTSARQKSPTFDEPTHLFAGYSYLKWADFRVNPEHPPFAKLWSALPLLAFDIQDPRESNPLWDLIASHHAAKIHTINLAGKMLFRDHDADTLFFYARLQMMALGILLGLFVFLWSKKIYGFEAAVAALFIYCLDPNVLAHSQIIHTDIPFTLFFFTGIYFLFQMLAQFTWRNVLLTSLPLGLATITKYSYIAILPIWGILGLMTILSSQSQHCHIGPNRSVSSRWGKTGLFAAFLICAAVTAYFCIWAAYGFRYEAIPKGGNPLPTDSFLSKIPSGYALASYLIEQRLFPEAWIYGQLAVVSEMRRPAYLLGQLSDAGFWSYFPVVFAVKTPLPTLVLIVAAAAMWISKRKESQAELFLILPVAMYFGFAIVSRMNLGVRHLLPIYPFLFVLAGGAAAMLWRNKPPIKIGAALLAAWFLWSSIRIYPHYLAFFNELAGGAKNGHKVLLDSNLDWGQDLKGLKRWMQDHEVKKIHLIYFGTANPQYYGIDMLRLPGSWSDASAAAEANYAEADHWAISASHFGPYLRDRQRDFVKTFGLLKPIATIGHSIFIYRMTQALAQHREAVQFNPLSGDAHHRLAILLDHQGRKLEAIEHYREAIRLDPSSTRSVYNLGILLANRSKKEEAIEYLRKTVEMDPVNVEAHYDLGLVLAMNGNPVEAVEQFRVVLKLDPSYTRGHYSLGVALGIMGDLTEAIEHFRAVVRLDPLHFKAHYNLGLMLVKQGNLTDAIDHFKQALRLQPGVADIHENLARALLQKGDRDAAVRHYEEAVRIIKSSRPLS
jgi:tetratricopeptide (TPR) repeat protein